MCTPELMRYAVMSLSQAFACLYLYYCPTIILIFRLSQNYMYNVGTLVSVNNFQVVKAFKILSRLTSNAFHFSNIRLSAELFVAAPIAFGQLEVNPMRHRHLWRLYTRATSALCAWCVLLYFIVDVQLYLDLHFRKYWSKFIIEPQITTRPGAWTLRMPTNVALQISPTLTTPCSMMPDLISASARFASYLFFFYPVSLEQHTHP